MYRSIDQDIVTLTVAFRQFYFQCNSMGDLFHPGDSDATTDPDQITYFMNPLRILLERLTRHSLAHTSL